MDITSLLIGFIVGFLAAILLWFFLSKWGMENTARDLNKKQKEDQDALKVSIAKTNEE